MKIAINTRFLLPNKLEGIGWFTLEVAKRMVQNHPEDEFYFFFDRPYSEEFIFGPNVTPVVLTPPARHPVLWAIWFEWAVAKALRKLQPDVFFSPDGYLSLRSKVPTVMVTHDIAHVHFPEHVNWMATQYYNYFVPKFLKKAAQVVAVSKFTKRDIIKQYGIEASKIQVAGNGCLPIFHPLNEPEKRAVKDQFADGQNYFFYLGAVQPRKNVHRLIVAFDRFKKRTQASTKLLIAGRFAWKTGPVKTAYDEAKHQSDIHFLGYVSDEDRPRLLAASLALTYVSLFEGFGVPLLEAMHAEVPMITSTTSSMPEVAGKAALLVNPEIIDQIAVAMQRLHEEKNLRNELIEAGRQQRNLFSWDKTAAEIYNTMQIVIKKTT